MSNVAVRVEGLSKQYKIGSAQTRKDNIREVIGDIIATPMRRMGNLLRGEAYGAAELNETIWALKDVSFEVKHGEAIGIIGRNGAGKSTLLKILSQITEPSEGIAQLYGRVGALLEVGTGFHQELTGRENIYLNGAILGMSRTEIHRKFDEIVDFSGVEKFIDTPVKHYSSGMRVRLGFSVAAHLEPEILIVDEVLSVGDAEFQKRCLGKMDNVAQEGRTVLFVSHNMAAISNLCDKVIWLDRGQVKAIAQTNIGISDYLFNDSSNKPTIAINMGDPQTAILQKLEISNGEQNTISFRSAEPIEFTIKYTVFREIHDAQVAIAIVASDGAILFASLSSDNPSNSTVFTPGDYIAKVKIPGFFLNTGRYSVNLRIWGRMANSQKRQAQATALGIGNFSVEDIDALATKFNDRRGGYLAPKLNWVVQFVAD